MTIQYTFSGHSDDLFCVRASNGTGDEMDNCANGKPLVYLVEHPTDGKFYVWGLYSPANDPVRNGCWVIGIQMFDEDVPIPKWGYGVHPEHGYSHALLIVAPDGTQVTPVGKDEED